jgi:DNA-binding response OmpR family regulator
VHLATESAGVSTAHDGEDAWEALQAEAFDLLLVDLEMPKLDGFGLVQRMRADPLFQGLPVIVVTGREDIAAIDKAFECGATSFIVKPINWRLLSYQVRFVLRSHRAEASLHAAQADVGAEEARTNSMIRLLLKESAELLRLAVARGDDGLRNAARRYGALLSGLSYAEARTPARGRAA